MQASIHITLYYCALYPIGSLPGLSVYGWGRIQPTGGTKKANTIDPATYWQYFIPFSRSKYARKGKIIKKVVARLIIIDLGSKPWKMRKKEWEQKGKIVSAGPISRESSNEHRNGGLDK